MIGMSHEFQLADTERRCAQLQAEVERLNKLLALQKASYDRERDADQAEIEALRKALAGQPAVPVVMADLVNQLFQIMEGWNSATYGWQADLNDPVKSTANWMKAKTEHADECKRRIRAAIDAVLAARIGEKG